MSVLNRLKYFIFISRNWNWKIAVHLLKEERQGEKKYNLTSTGYDKLIKLKSIAEELEHSTIYMPASFVLLELCFKEVDLQKSKHFLDIGCGMGRAMVVAAHFGAKKITGIDIAKTLFTKTKTNLAKLKNRWPNVITNYSLQNAYYYEIPDDVDVIFLFNPFDEFVMNAVVENILASLERKMRLIKIIYFNPMEKQCFTQNGFKQIFQFKTLEYLEAIILENKIAQ